ncbi:serine/threonine-protein kinase [Micromonospora sp. MA102]|uniref:serine/threonine-protein kinase n=1 Tax=Micromonospora sp. MA102 TaxID=2952755 RepID=UPI00290577E7|nr:serine/threonine-protein kinase [Micromonospora sp. MA102]
MLTQGVVLSDRYRLGERIATGGMGAVWKCTDTLLSREVAVKVLLPSLVADPEFTTRFHAEARMLAALRHPGIVQVHDFGSATLADGGQVSYLVMEYVDGEPLVTWIRRAGRLDPASTMSVVGQAAHALHAAHLAGIVHRDVKPGNLLVKRDGTVVLVDFGIARASTMAGITAAHMVLGTASYMSPEQAAGQPVSPVTDVYALGAVAYYCLAGRPPFEGDNPLQVAMRHVQDEPPPLVGTPPAVVEVVGRALAKRPADRFPSALALAEAAQDARDATLARLPAPPRPPWAVAGPAVPGPAVLPAPTPDPPAATPPAGQPSTGQSPAGQPPAGPPPAGRPVFAPGHASAVPAPVPGAPGPGSAPGSAPGPVWAAGVAQASGEPGHGSLRDRHAGSAEPPTLEEPAERRGRGRALALAGAAGVVLVAVLTAVVVAVLHSPDDPDPGQRPAALTGESAVADPGQPDESTSAGASAEPTPSRTGKPSRSPSTTPSRPAAGGGGPSAGDPAPTTGAPGPTGSTAAPQKPNPYTAAQACGSGYQVIDSATLTAGGVRRGRVYLLYSTAGGTNCVVTLKDTDVGQATTVTAYLEVQGKARQTESGAYRYYAGPVRASAAGACVKWGGSAGGASYGSAFEHCD